ncbi:MAG: hypothetical protein JRF24_05070 [Deltaproteobacteria bacterium]|nr:hypothetical protein [Deltaproteobacteria bacterium]
MVELDPVHNGTQRASGVDAPSQNKEFRRGVPWCVAQVTPWFDNDLSAGRQDCGKGPFLDGNQLNADMIKKKFVIGEMAVIPAICFFAFFLWAVEAAETKAGQAPAYVPGELLVKFTPAVRIVASDNYRARLGVSSLKTYEITGAQHVKLPEGMTVEEALEIYRNDPDVEYAEPNYYRYATATPNDPSFDDLWGLHNTGQTGGTPDADIDAPEAW